MGWAKYDEDNRDYIEERWAGRAFHSTVCNYTCNYGRMQKGSAYDRMNKSAAYVWQGIHTQYDREKGWK